MLSWFRRRFRPVPLREWALPGEIGTISFPVAMEVSPEDDSTLLAEWPETDDICLRVSSMTVERQDGQENSAIEAVRHSARERNHKTYTAGERLIEVGAETEVEENGMPLILRQWLVGMKTSVTIITATIRRDRRTSELVTRTLEVMPRIVESVNIRWTQRTIRSGGMTVETRRGTAEAPSPRSVAEFGPREREWLRRGLELSRDLAIRYGSGGELRPEELDRVFARWTAETDEKESGVDVAHALGAAFGNYLVETHAFRWRLISDEFGTEFAVCHELGDTTAFPRASVERRIEDGECDMFRALTIGIVDCLKERRAEQAPQG